MSTLQKRIKDIRLKRGLSQLDLASLIGVSQPTVANWENGSHIPRHNALQQIGHALSVDPMWLISGDMNSPAPASQIYLSQALIHVPVYRWSTLENQPAKTLTELGHNSRIVPIGYTPFSVSTPRPRPLFALETPPAGNRSDAATPAPAQRTLLICTAQAKRHNAADTNKRPYLALNADGAVIIHTPTNPQPENAPDILAHIICTMIYHDIAQTA